LIRARSGRQYSSATELPITARRDAVDPRYRRRIPAAAVAM
jgi:hypothetical protein